jgi:nucleotide-binding universal stress UspA family protein
MNFGRMKSPSPDVHLPFMTAMVLWPQASNRSNPMRRILVPLDGSPFGETALMPAGDIAERTGGCLELVTVKTPVHVRARAYLDRHAEALHRQFELAVFTTVLDGPVPSAIAEHVREDPPALIVMSTHARPGPSRPLSGSVADRLLRELHCPLILLRPGTIPAVGQLPSVPRVLVALDGSALAETVLDEVSRFLPREMTTLLLLRVIAPAEVFPVGTPVTLPAMRPNLLEARQAAAEAYLESTASKLREVGWQVEHDVVVGWDPAVEVTRWAATRHCDLIAIATRGRGGVRRMFLGSVADKVIRCSSTPILIVNPLAGASSRILGEQLEAASAGAEP